MATPHEHVDQMKEMANYIVENNDFITEAEIDDWGSFSNFTLIIGVGSKRWPRGTTNKIKGAVNRAIKSFGNSEMHVRDYFPPEAIRRWNNASERMELVDHHDYVWKFDVDYNDFDFESNTFS